MIDRTLQNNIQKRWKDNKVIIVLGPRQAGKTTLINNICKQHGSYLQLNGDDPEIRELLANAGKAKLKEIISNHKTIFIDEAQRIPNIGLTAKIIHDQIPDKRLILSGSSALEITNHTYESLTGRKWEYQLFPISWSEYKNHTGYLNAYQQLTNRLIYGMYPEVITNADDQAAILNNLTQSYLYKDLLQFEGIRKPELLEKLLIALAHQIGSEVNFNELSGLLRIDRTTIEKYIDLLCKSYVIFKLHPLSRNPRKELSTGRKIYFWDNGIRNSLISNLKSFELRQDKGALWENFIISEKLKSKSYTNWYGHFWFWRSYQKQEIDLIEEIDGSFKAYEIKWNTNKKGKFSKTFLNDYQPIELYTINTENFDNLIQSNGFRIPKPDL